MAEPERQRTELELEGRRSPKEPEGRRCCRGAGSGLEGAATSRLAIGTAGGLALAANGGGLAWTADGRLGRAASDLGCLLVFQQ